MKHFRYLATTVALTCAFATGSVLADSGTTTGNSARDRDVSSQLASELLRDTAVGPYGIRVVNRQGAVRLSGSVGSIRDWKKADEDARNTEGVTQVQNDLSVLIR